MAVAVKCIYVDQTRRFTRRRYSLTLSGNYVTGGDTVNFLTLNKNGQGRAIPPSKPLPGNDQIDIDSVPASYGAVLKQNGASPTLANFLIQFYTTANTELPAAGYPAALSAIPIEVEIITPKSDG